MSVEEAPQYIVTTPSDSGDDGSNSAITTTSTNLNNKSVSVSSRSISHSSRSHSLQSSTSSSSTIVAETSVSSASGSLNQNLHKAVSSANIVTTEKHYQQKSTTTKGKFQSFLQHPDSSSTSSHFGSSFLNAQQKHVRQFVRSTSAHSEGGIVGGATGSVAATSTGAIAKPDKYIRSASAQIDDGTEVIISGGGLTHSMEQPLISKGLQQSSTILISKSAETFESKSLTTTGAMRTQLTLSGGFLAPPNRKLTILSPIHAPPGLHDMLKRHGRSPLSPRISFPGSDADLFP